MIKKEKAAKAANQTGKQDMTERIAVLNQLQSLKDEYFNLESELCARSPKGLSPDDTARLNAMLKNIEEVEATL